MNNFRFNIGAPLEWKTINCNADVHKLGDLRVYAIRRAGETVVGQLNRFDYYHGMQHFVKTDSSVRWPEHQYPFDVALIPAPQVSFHDTDSIGWIGVNEIGGLSNLGQRHYELKGPWREHGYPHDTVFAFRFNGTVGGCWAVAGGGDKLPEVFEKHTTHVRDIGSNIPPEWVGKMPKQVTEEQRLRDRVAELERKLDEVAKAAGNGGA